MMLSVVLGGLCHKRRGPLGPQRRKQMVCKTEMEVTIHATFSRFPKCLNGGFDCSRVKCPQCQD